MLNLLKYPRTQHIEGSRLQEGDEDIDALPFSALSGRHLVVEEKMDGANCAISFDEQGKLLLQSRGHYLTGGSREKHFNLLKQWANIHVHSLYKTLSDRYIMYGEWLYAKHTIFYNQLPHYFMEFDIYDRQQKIFLDTPSRHALLEEQPVTSVRILHQGPTKKLKELTSLITSSIFIQEGHIDSLRNYCESNNLDAARAIKETDPNNLMEGLYIKHESEGKVQGRYKFVRASFLQAVFQAEGHWLNRPIIPNTLHPNVDIFKTNEK